MATIRKARESKGFAMSRALAQDEKISFEARGLMSYLLSKPTSWQAQLTDIERAGNIGRDQRLRIIAELETAGYIERLEVRDKGKISYELLVHEEPLPENERTHLTRRQNPQLENPPTDEPQTGKPSPENPYTVDADAYIDREVQSKELQGKERRERAASPPAPLCPECKTPGQSRTTNEGPAVFCQTHGLKIISSGVVPKTAQKNAPGPLMHNPAVLEFKAVHGFAPERGLARETIAMRIVDVPRWSKALRSWKLRGLNPKNIEGQIDWYDNGVPVHKAQPTAPQPRKAVIPG